MFRVGKPVTMFLVFVMTTVGLTSVGTPAAEAKGACLDTAITTLKLRGSTTTTVSLIAKSIDDGKERLVYVDTTRSLSTGAPTVTITTCKSPTTHKWKVLVASFANQMKDLKVYEKGGKAHAEPVSGKYGLGVFAKGITGSKVKIVLTKCLQEAAPLTVLGVVKELLGLPIPLKTSYAVGIWVLNKALPEAPAGEFTCGNLGTKNLKFSINKKSGKATMTTGSVKGSAKVKKVFQCYYREVCTQTTTDELIVRKP